MTELSDTTPIPENDNATPRPSLPWVMLISMLLLISVLILSSAMLVHYAMDGREGRDKESAFNFAKLMEKGKALSAKATVAREQKAPENEPLAPSVSTPLNSGIKNFFPSPERGAVRWPKLKLTGFGKSSDSESSFAIINGKQVLVNTPIGEVTLVEISNNGAVVEYKGERKILTVELAR